MKSRPAIAERIVRKEFPEFGGLFSVKEPQEVQRKPHTKRKLRDGEPRRSKRRAIQVEGSQGDAGTSTADAEPAALDPAAVEQNGVLEVEGIQ